MPESDSILALIQLHNGVQGYKPDVCFLRPVWKVKKTGLGTTQ